MCRWCRVKTDSVEWSRTGRDQGGASFRRPPCPCVFCVCWKRLAFGTKCTSSEADAPNSAASRRAAMSVSMDAVANQRETQLDSLELALPRPNVRHPTTHRNSG